MTQITELRQSAQLRLKWLLVSWTIIVAGACSTRTRNAQLPKDADTVATDSYDGSIGDFSTTSFFDSADLSSSSEISTGAGITAYRRNTLALLSDEGEPVRLAAHVIGFSNIEQLAELPNGDFTARVLADPPSLDVRNPRYPLGITVGDVDGNGLRDVVVFDPEENWVAYGRPDGTFLSSALPAELKGLPSTEDPLFETVRGVSVMVAPNAWEFYATSRKPSGQWSKPEASEAASPFSGMASPQCIFLASGTATGSDLVCLSNWSLELAQFFTYDMTAMVGGILPARHRIAPTHAPPYVVPFDAFDHLKRIPIPSCERSMAGVGVFGSGTFGATRRIQRIALAADGFSISELSATSDVVTFDLVSGVDSDAIAGVIEESSNGAVFEVYRIADCTTWDLLGRLPTDFAWRTAPSPGFGPNSEIPKTYGVQLLGWRTHVQGVPSSNHYKFAHYDGYSIRVWTVEVTNGTTSNAELHSFVFSLHSERRDLIAP